MINISPSIPYPLSPETETARLGLRPLASGDLDAIHRLWTDPDVRKYLWDDQVISKERAASVIADSIASFQAHRFGRWGVFPRGKEPLIGFCGLRFFGELLGSWRRRG